MIPNFFTFTHPFLKTGVIQGYHPPSGLLPFLTQPNWVLFIFVYGRKSDASLWTRNSRVLGVFTKSELLVLCVLSTLLLPLFFFFFGSYQYGGCHTKRERQCVYILALTNFPFVWRNDCEHGKGIISHPHLPGQLNASSWMLTVGQRCY